MSTVTRLSKQGTRPAQGFLSIRAYLAVLIAAILVPMLAAVGWFGWKYASSARAAIEAERLDVATDLLQLSDHEIGGLAGFLRGVSIAPGLRTGDTAAIERISLVTRERGFRAFGVYDRTGRLQFASPAERAATFPAADQAGVAEIVGGRPFVVSGFATSFGAGEAANGGLFHVSVPIMVGGEIVQVLTASMPLQHLQALFAQAGLRDEWTATIVDGKGTVLARSQRPETYVGKPSKQAMIDAAQGPQTSGLFEAVSFEGIEVKYSYRRSAATGWTVAVAVPTVVVNTPLRQSAIAMGIVLICAVLISILLGLYVASRIVHGVRELGHAVVAMASGDTVGLPTNTIAELQDVLRVIEATAAMKQPGPLSRRL